MTTGKPHLALKIGALAFAVSLSGFYIYLEFRGQPAPDDADPPVTGSEAYPMSKTPGLDLIEALPKSGPIHFNPERFSPEQADTDPAIDGTDVEPGKRPAPNFQSAPGFDLNDALSKTGTIKADKFFNEDKKEDAKQPAAENAKE